MQDTDEKQDLVANLQASAKQAAELEKQVEAMLKVGLLLPPQIVAVATCHLLPTLLTMVVSHDFQHNILGPGKYMHARCRGRD